MAIDWGTILRTRPTSPLEYMQQQQMNQGNIDKIKAMIAQTNLANKKSEAELPYAGKTAEAKLRDLLAQAAERETETKYIPTKYNILGQNAATSRMSAETALKNYLLNQQRYSPERLKLQDEYRKELIKAIPARMLTAEGKSILEQQNIEQGFLPSGQLAAGGKPISPDLQSQLQKSYELQRIKRNTDSALRKAFPQIESIDNTLSSVPFESVSQFYGPRGQLKAAAEFAKSQAGMKISPEYQEYRDFITTKGPSLVGQMRQFLQDSVTPGAQEHLRGIVFPKKWSSNPELAIEQFNALKNIYDIEKAARVRAANDPSLYLGLSKKSKEKVDKLYNPPSFSSKEDFFEWRKNASPQEIEQYKKYLSG